MPSQSLHPRNPPQKPKLERLVLILKRFWYQRFCIVVGLIKIRPFESTFALLTAAKLVYGNRSEACRTERLTDTAHGSALFLPETSGLYSD